MRSPFAKSEVDALFRLKAYSTPRTVFVTFIIEFATVTALGDAEEVVFLKILCDIFSRSFIPTFRTVWRFANIQTGSYVQKGIRKDFIHTFFASKTKV